MPFEPRARSNNQQQPYLVGPRHDCVPLQRSSSATFPGRNHLHTLKLDGFWPFAQQVKEVQGVGATVVESVVAAQPADDLRELIGKRIGNYVIDRPLGRGGMAVVFVAKHPTLGREVAVKFLKPALHGDLEMAERFLQEAKVTATLAHPNVVEILDFGEFERRPYYMMELLQGEDLRAKLRDNRQRPYREVVSYLEQICDALDAAHKVGVVHRDLKPDNIFVIDEEPLKVKVMDFGVAKAVGEPRIGQTLHGQVLGTPTHMAPEQALGHIERISPLTDLYALGVIAFEMLTGQLPFIAESALMVLSMHIRDPVPSIRALAPEVPKRIAELVESCMAKEPSNRPRSARTLATQLVTACRMAERTRAAEGGAAKLTSAHDAKIVEELAQRLARQEKAANDEVERFGIKLPEQVSVQLSDAPAAISDVPPSNDFDASLGFSDVPPARTVVGARGEGFKFAPAVFASTPKAEPAAAPFSSEASATQKSEGLDTSGAEAVQRGNVSPGGFAIASPNASPGALQSETGFGTLASAPRRDAGGFEFRGAVPVAHDTRALAVDEHGGVGHDEHDARSERGAANAEVGVPSSTGRALGFGVPAPESTRSRRLAAPILDGFESDPPRAQPPRIETAQRVESPARAEAPRGQTSPQVEYQTGAAILGLPGQTLVSETPIGARLRALQRPAPDAGAPAVVVVAPVAAADERPNEDVPNVGFEPAPPPEPLLLSEITEEAAPVSTKSTIEDGAILERLLRRMQRRGDFPSFLSNMAEIVTKSNSEGQYSAGQLAEALRKDFGLTAKLLKVVNTAFMSRFKGRVYSVHQAIVILGFDSVRSIASSVLVYKVPGVGEGQGKHQSVEGKYNTRLAESAINSLVSGEIARLLSAGSKLRLDSEIAMMAATFRNLGQHLVMQYLPEEYSKIEDLMAREDLALSVASERVLGLPLRKLGVGVMQRWQLPTILCDAVSSQARPGQPLERDADRLGALAKFATDLCDIVARGGQAAWQPSVQKLLERNRMLLVMDEQQVGGLIATISKSFEERFSALLGPYCTKSRFIANAQAIINETNPEALGPPPVVSIPPETARLEALVKQIEEDIQKRKDPDKLARRALTAVSEKLNVPRVLLLTVSADKRQMEVRAGVGQDVDALKQVLKVPITQAGNVFAAALATNKPIVVDDALSSKFTKRVPQPYYEVIGSPCFVLLSCIGVGYPGAVLLVDVNAAEHIPDDEAMTATRGLRNVLVQVAYRLG